MKSVALIEHTSAMLGLSELTQQEVVFIQSMLSGLPLVTAASRAGVMPDEARDFAARPHVASVLGYLREELMSSQIEIDRNMLNLMLLESHAKAANATEEIMAVRELATLNGLKAPTQVNHTVSQEPKTQEQMRRLPTSELAKLAGDDIIDGEWEEMEDGDDEL